MKTAKEFLDSNLGLRIGEIDSADYDASISAIHEYASERCYGLLTMLAEEYFSDASGAVRTEQIAKFRYDWLRDNIT